LGRWALVQLGRLGPDAAVLALAVSVLERAGILEAAQLARLAPDEATTAAASLVRAGVLEQQPLGFAHPILRRAVYLEIPASERAEAHGRAARLLAESHESTARVAEHLLATAPAADHGVVERLRDAASGAAASGAPESAAAYLVRALAEPPTRDVSAAVLVELGRAEFSAGLPDWQHHLEAAVAAADDDTTRISIALQLAVASAGAAACSGGGAARSTAAGLAENDTGGRVLLLIDGGRMRPARCDDRRRLPALAPCSRSQTSRPHRAPLAIAACEAALAEANSWAAALAPRSIATRVSDPGEAPWLAFATVALVWTNEGRRRTTITRRGTRRSKRTRAARRAGPAGLACAATRPTWRRRG
jgi:hypothetical protein